VNGSSGVCGNGRAFTAVENYFIKDEMRHKKLFHESQNVLSA
jgi:hypothetical protein